MSQRGENGMKYMPIASAAPGTAASANIQRQLFESPAKPQSTMYAARMPSVTISWLKLTTPPRIRGGTSSAMYIGETNEARADGEAEPEAPGEDLPVRLRERAADRADDVDGARR